MKPGDKQILDATLFLIGIVINVALVGAEHGDQAKKQIPTARLQPDPCRHVIICWNNIGNIHTFELTRLCGELREIGLSRIQVKGSARVH